MRKYKEWSENGKPELTREEIDQAVSEPKSPGKRVNNTDVPENKSVVLSDISAIDSAGVTQRKVFNILRPRRQSLRY